MARCFEISPQSITVGTATNNVNIQFGYQRDDHSQCVMIVTPTGTLAAATEVVIQRNSRIASVLAALNATDQIAVGAQIAQGGPVDSSTVPRGGGISGTGTPF